MRFPRLAQAAALGALVLAGLAGCLGPDAPEPEDAAGPGPVGGAIDHAALASTIGHPITMEHDHNDALLHTQSHNLDFVGWSSLGIALGSNGFANFDLYDEPDGRTVAFVAVDGDDRAGFVIADVTDPTQMQVLGSHFGDGNNVQEVRVTPDGRFLAVNIQALPAPAYLASVDGPGDCGVCIQLFNVEDRSAPRLVAVLPVEVLGTHNLQWYQFDGADSPVLFYVGQPLLGTNPDPAGNRIGIAQLRELADGEALLVAQQTFFHETSGDGGRSFPHDVTVTDHPVTGQVLAYVSHWDGGALIFDVSSVLAASPNNEIARNADRAPSSALAIHWLVQEEEARADGRVIAWSAPEIGSLDDGTGVIRSYDVSDPTRLVQLGTWELPGDNLSISGAGGNYILSPHIAMPDQATGLLAVAHYHAGVWVLDMSDPSQPMALGYYLPHGDPAQPYTGEIWWKKPNFDPTGYLPNVYMARWHGGLLWVSERGTGLYALQYTGPVPGPVT